jgi:peptidoglycan hydrolase CwlO-like protein
MVMAAVNAIIRLIMSKGVQEAIKKHGSAAVKEARKHMNDLMSKPTKGQEAVKTLTPKQRAYRAGQRKAAVAGAGATAVAGAAYKAGQTSKNNTKRQNKVGSRTANMLNTSYRGKEVSRTDLNKRKKK